MAVSPDGSWVICTSESASLVHFIDARSGKLVESAMVGTRPREARFTADGHELWVSSEVRGTVTVFAMPSRERRGVIDLDVADAPATVQAVGIAVDPDCRRAFVALGRGNGVAEIDRGTNQLRRVLPAGQRDWSIALGAQGRLYAANGLSGDVSVIDRDSGQVLATIATGGKPWGVVVKP
jgi:YVTN family beta-propeller protein